MQVGRVVVDRDRVQVDDAEERLAQLLRLRVLAEAADVVAEVLVARRLDAAEDSHRCSFRLAVATGGAGRPCGPRATGDVASAPVDAKRPVDAEAAPPVLAVLARSVKTARRLHSIAWPSPSPGRPIVVALARPRCSSPTGPIRGGRAVRERLRSCRRSSSRARCARCRPALGEAAEGRAFLLQAGRLRRVVPRRLDDPDPREAQGPPADVGRADVRRGAAGRQGRAHRRPVREAALVADRARRRRRAAVVPRAHRPLRRGHRRRAHARSRPHRPGLLPGGLDPQPAARLHEGRVRRHHAGAHVEPGVRRRARPRAAATSSSRTRSATRSRSCRRCGIDLGDERSLHEVDVCTSHEALLLDYEEPLVRARLAHRRVVRAARRTSSGSASARASWTARTSSSSPASTTRSASSSGRRRRPTRSSRSASGSTRGRVPGRLTLITRLGAGRVARGAAAARCGRCARAGMPVRLGLRPDAREHVRHAVGPQDAPLRRRHDARSRASSPPTARSAPGPAASTSSTPART